jgi:hypothetical protein
MVKIEIDDELWRLYKKSWVRFGVKTEDRVIVMLEDFMWRSTADSLKGADKKLAWSLYCKIFSKQSPLAPRMM